MAISVIGQAQAAATTVTVPAHAIGDYIVIFAYRNATTAPTLPTGYTSIVTDTGNANSFRLGYKVATATNDTSGTWTNANVLQCVVYRGPTGIGASEGTTHAASTTVTTPSLALDITSGKSWVAAFAGSKQTTSLGIISGLTQRGTSQAGTTSIANVADTNGGVSSFAGGNATAGSSATYSYAAVELIAPDTSPSTTLNTPTNTSTGISTTPQLNFSGTDAEGDTITYELQVDTVNTFDSQSGGTPTLLAHTGKQLGSAGGTTTGIDTTGANLIIVGLSYDNGGTANLTDNKSNTWTALTKHNITSNGVSQLYYCFNPTVGTGHTFSSTSIFSAITIQAWDGASTSPFDVQNGATGTAATLLTGSITPTANGELVVSHFMYSAAGTATIDSSMTISDQENFVSSANYGSALASIIQTTAGAIDPKWSFSGGSTPLAATIASFKMSASAPLIDAFSATGGHDALQFADVTNALDTDPFASGDSINFTLLSAEILIPGDTYYWRVRGKDPAGSDAFGSWSSTFSFTTSGSVSVSQLAAAITAAGGVQAIVAQASASVTQLAATVTATGGTQAVTAIQKGVVAQVHAAITATGGTQAVVAVGFATVSQLAATITASGGTQVATVLRSATVAQVAALITATGGTQSIAIQNNATVTQVHATITATGGTQALHSGVSAFVAQLAAVILAAGGTQTVMALRGGPDSALIVVTQVPNPTISVGVVPNPLITIDQVANPLIEVANVNPAISVAQVPNPSIEIEAIENPLIQVSTMDNLVVSVSV